MSTVPGITMTDERLDILEDRAKSRHPYLSELAKRKLREFGDCTDVSAYRGKVSIPEAPDADGLYEEFQIRMEGQ